MTFHTIFGVDFSGAKLAGRNTWVARLERRTGRGAKSRPYALAELHCVERLCGTAERAAALAHLVGLIKSSDGALWAAVGGERAWREADHARIARHPRYPREGHLYV